MKGDLSRKAFHNPSLEQQALEDNAPMLILFVVLLAVALVLDLEAREWKKSDKCQKFAIMEARG